MEHSITVDGQAHDAGTSYTLDLSSHARRMSLLVLHYDDLRDAGACKAGLSVWFDLFGHNSIIPTDVAQKIVSDNGVAACYLRNLEWLREHFAAFVKATSLACVALICGDSR